MTLIVVETSITKKADICSVLVHPRGGRSQFLWNARLIIALYATHCFADSASWPGLHGHVSRPAASVF